MNNLSTHVNPRNVPNGAMDVWSQNQNPTALGMPSPHQSAPAASPTAVVQRLLRGRVALAVVLALIGAIMGGAGGYMSQAPTFKSSGVVRISPLIPMVDGDKTIQYYQQFMTSEQDTIRSPKVINEVPKFEPWKSLVGKNSEALGDISANMKALYQRNTFNIALEYANPNQKIASAAMQSVIAAYAAQFSKNSIDPIRNKIAELDRQQKKNVEDTEAANRTITDVTRKYGTPALDNLVSAAQNKVEQIDRELRVNENQYKNATDAITSRKGTDGKLSTVELAAVQPILANMINQLRESQAQLNLDEKLLSSQHPKVRQERIAVQVKADGVEALADTIRKEVLAIIPDMVKGGGEKIQITAGDLKLLETRVNTLRTEMAAARAERDQIAAAAATVADQQNQIHKLTADAERLATLMTRQQYAAAGSGTLDVVQDGAFASKASDKKILFGLAGAIGGGLVPVGLLMLLGLMDTRFRYSDDAAGQSMAGIPLLGILPNLPDRLSDPAQASIAAHCVHQIRTMLQLNAMRENGSTAFAITSASSGDGKTSLSLALGLSFAASGSRTLLIDADLVGGGLTSRLGNDTAVGIVDALAGVGLEECVQPTDVSDLSLLPIGSAQAHHAGSFSPPAVRKLLAEIRKHYEVIIIDTGPVMGSIEATPIAASVDGVVLTVARGQSRPLVERAITHLNSIGARVAGVVFNRAQHKDFEQSIGAISVRSAARSTMNGTGHNGRKNGDMGAVAAAVHTNVRNEN